MKEQREEKLYNKGISTDFKPNLYIIKRLPFKHIPCILSETLEHEEVNKRVVSCGRLAEQGGNEAIISRYFLHKDNHTFGSENK